MEPRAISGFGLRILETRAYYDTTSGNVIHVHRLAVRPGQEVNDDLRRGVEDRSMTASWIFLASANPIYQARVQSGLTLILAPLERGNQRLLTLITTYGCHGMSNVYIG